MGLTFQPTLQAKGIRSHRRVAIRWRDLVVRLASLAGITAILFLCADSLGGHLNLRHKIGAACILFATVLFAGARLFERRAPVRQEQWAGNSTDNPYSCRPFGINRAEKYDAEKRARKQH